MTKDPMLEKLEAMRDAQDEEGGSEESRAEIEKAIADHKKSLEDNKGSGGR